MPPEGQPSGGDFALYSALPHFFDVVNVIQRRERFDDLAVGLILFQLGAAYGECHGEYAQPRTGIRLIRLNIVDAKPSRRLTVTKSRR